MTSPRKPRRPTTAQERAQAAFSAQLAEVARKLADEAEAGNVYGHLLADLMRLRQEERAFFAAPR